ncbi:MAG TPA: NADH-quinone oxidoreductase subunit H [Catalimonadaceae bacterium]|nr:NADH-quinone oxidoreductase subunit H [Catalimonadaceae bacterium]
MNPDWLSYLLLFIANLSLTLASVLVFFYAERKGSAFIQDRLGPTHVGRFGLLQPMADLLKLAQKETLIPANARKSLFILAPFLVFGSVFSAFALLPIWPLLNPDGLPQGSLLLILGLLSIEAVGILMASYASQSKFPWLAAGRALSQMMSYEVPLGISILCFCWISNSANLSQIQNLQGSSPVESWLSWPWNLIGFIPGNGTGIIGWNLFRYPVLILLAPVFFITIMAESNRAPFDIPEGESEIIGGFHTEYSGFMWAVFFLAEYAMMLILSLLFSYLFLGGNSSVFPGQTGVTFLSAPAVGWLVAKAWLLCFVMIWIRWTLPRLRVDQLMGLGWKILTPVSLLVFLLCIVFK